MMQAWTFFDRSFFLKALVSRASTDYAPVYFTNNLLSSTRNYPTEILNLEHICHRFKRSPNNIKVREAQIFRIS